MAIRGIIRSMPDYVVHYRAGLSFPREGREFVVDDDKIKTSSVETARGRYWVDDPKFPGVKEKRIEKMVKAIDIEGQPLVLSTDGYEYMRQVFGTSLVCEPVGGVDAMDLAAENERLRARIAELEAASKAKK